MGARSIIRVLYGALFEHEDEQVQAQRVERMARAEQAHNHSLAELRRVRRTIDTRPDEQRPRAYVGTFVDLQQRIEADNEAMLEVLGGD